MSSEIRHTAAVNAGLTDGIIIAGGEQAGNPLDRASYSNSPYFTAGADCFPLPASQTLLAEPAIVDALDAVDQITHSRQDQSEEHSLAVSQPETPIDFNLAKQGLSRLKTELSGHSSRKLQVAVADTRRRLPAYQERLADSRRAAENAARTQEAQTQTAETGHQKKQVERAREAARQASYRQEVDKAIELVEARQTKFRFDPTPFTELSDEITLDEDANGLTARGKPGFWTKVDQFTDAYMEDPVKFLDYLCAVTSIVALKSPDRAVLRDENDPVYVYGYKIITEIASSLSKKVYSIKDLSPELITKWMRLAEALPHETDTDESEPTTDFPEGNDITLMLNTVMITGQNILARSLAAVADQHPKKLVDNLYALAETGLDADNADNRHFTLHVLEECLIRNGVVGHILGLSVGAEQHPDIQRKAIDLQLTLADLGVPADLLNSSSGKDQSGRGTVRVNQLDRRQRQVIRKLYPSAFYQSNLSPVNERAFRARNNDLYQRQVSGLWELANTPEGKTSTLYGRFLAAREAQTAAASDDLLPEDA